MKYIPNFIEKDTEYKACEDKINTVLEHIYNLKFVMKVIESKANSSVDEENVKEAKEKMEIVQEKIDNCYELIEKIVGENKILAQRYCYYSYFYSIIIEDELVSKEVFNEKLGSENIYSFDMNIKENEDNIHRTTMIYIICKNDSTIKKLHSFVNDMCWNIQKENNYQEWYDSKIMEHTYGTDVCFYNNPNDERHSKESDNQIYTDLIEKIMKFKYDFQTAKKIVRVLSIENDSICEVKELIFSKDLKKKSEDIITALQDFDYWVE
ncbi:hypothetical protein ENUP19_0146G0051 [Entamoeba nuttalli]|uniref:Uncharacterized protein n=2 Tax=Entamoeba nuttalli TaxID=412467 RepID=K2HS46_ENTNP|nr:hypothetical protein ENU1_149100 [Entamoeba nuttalli P19]EKE38880.1 hypothetical protein ENU1_149100 [Entamoeba nuttalli P19]|eukprot:XP_008858786.1 hypothetical protein ENU1_149100 [Entamoeba nuttalli P19]